jgi:N-acetylglucosaminyldiphosphoundecaprenol N-acetyl-beta-D-mannosaminyltransferase
LVRPIPIGRTSVHPLSRPEFVDVVHQRVMAGLPTTVFTPNVDHLVLLEQNEAFRRIYNAADLRVVDGAPVAGLLRAIGTPVPERLAGADIFDWMCALGAEKGHRVFILGGMPDALERALENVHKRYPGIIIDGWSPELGFEGGPDEQEALARIKEFAPQLLFVCFGAPRSELWIGRHRDALGTSVAMSLGAAVDFAAGTKMRAPHFVQAMGMEWLFRLIQEPRRLWRRYLQRDLAFVSIARREFARRRITAQRG